MREIDGSRLEQSYFFQTCDQCFFVFVEHPRTDLSIAFVSDHITNQCFPIVENDWDRTLTMTWRVNDFAWYAILTQVKPIIYQNVGIYALNIRPPGHFLNARHKVDEATHHILGHGILDLSICQFSGKRLVAQNFRACSLFRVRG